MDTSTARYRFHLVNLFLWLSFLAACLFYGVAENLLLLFMSSGLLLIAAALIPIASWRVLYQLQPRAFWLSGFVLTVLVLNYQFVSISPDSSFAMSWVLAALPLWYLVCAANPRRRILVLALAGTISVFALNSAVAFLGDGQRAYEPLGDPNHYASMLYLVWIPLAHFVLLGSWQRSLSVHRLLPLHLLLFVFALVIAATDSRVGAFILVAALAGWLLLLSFNRKSPWPWAMLLANTGLAVLVWWAVLPNALPSAVDAADFRSGVGIRGALNAAGVEMFLQQPLTGSGVFTFPLLYPLFRLQADQSTAGMFIHNDYLQLLVESGPWLLIPLLALMVAIARSLWIALFKPCEQSLAGYGLAMAAAALLAHASVNYVLYYLPLTILLAVVCAQLFAPNSFGVAEQVETDSTESAAGTDHGATTGSLRGAWFGSLILGFTTWAYLGLDVVTQGVFGNQPAPGLIADLKKDLPTMLAFADTAETLNDRRVTPVLAQALLFTALLESNPGSGVSKTAILERYRTARAMDPYNPVVYLQLYEFLNKHGDGALFALLQANESPEALLRKVVALELARTPSVFTLLSLYEAQGSPERGVAMLKEDVFPWVERIHWSQPGNARAVLTEMKRQAEDANDQSFLQQLARLEARLAQFQPADKPQRLRQWQQSFWQ